VALKVAHRWTHDHRPNVQAEGTHCKDSPNQPMDAFRTVLPPVIPRKHQETPMPSKLRRTSTAVKVKAYRSAITLAGLLVLLEALGAPRKL
jgi:hypothetical protein